MSLQDAIHALRKGLVVGVPTDTVYGIAVDPADPTAVRTLFELKGRPGHLPLVVLVASLAQAESLVDLTTAARRMISAHWPGALTAVLRSKVELAEGVGDHGRGTLAIRMPDHRLLAELLSRSGPLAVTSANRSGVRPALDASEARMALGDGVAVYLAGRCEGGRPSTVADLTRDPPRILREGPVVLGIRRHRPGRFVPNDRQLPSGPDVPGGPCGLDLF